MKLARIKKVLRMENNGEWARVYVQLEDGAEATIFISGEVEAWFDDAHNTHRAFVKKNKSA